MLDMGEFKGSRVKRQNREELPVSFFKLSDTFEESGEACSSEHTKNENDTLNRTSGHLEELSPISRLPMDLLGEIFRAYLHLAAVLHNQSQSHTDPEPWKLAQVCRSWRIAVLSQHTLWSKHIFDPLLATKLQSVEQRIQFCLTQPEECPLSFSYRIYPWSTIRIWEKLVSEARRWKHVELVDRGSEVFRNPEHSIELKRNLPRLESLRLEVHHDSGSLCTVFEGSPRLRNLHFGRAATGYVTLESVRMPWPQLTHLSLRHVQFAPGELLALLSQMPDLMELTWLDCLSEVELSRSMVLLPQLCTLSWHGNDLAQFMRSITVPCLTAIRIGGDEILVEAVAEFCTRSGCDIIKLGVDDRCMASALGLLDRMPNLRELDIDILQLDASQPLLDLLLSLHRIVVPTPPSLTVRVAPRQRVGAHNASCFLLWLLTKLESVNVRNRIRRIVVRVDEISEEMAEMVIRFNQSKEDATQLVLMMQ